LIHPRCWNVPMLSLKITLEALKRVGIKCSVNKAVI